MVITGPVAINALMMEVGAGDRSILPSPSLTGILDNLTIEARGVSECGHYQITIGGMMVLVQIDLTTTSVRWKFQLTKLHQDTND